jgi:putative ABC transport system substrate-binding protein
VKPGFALRWCAVLLTALLQAPAAAAAAIGFLAPDEEPRYTDLLRGLREGLLDEAAGGVGIVQQRVARGDAVRAAAAAESFAAARVQAVFVVGSELAKQLRAADRELPIVFITPGDPVRAGLADSLARPGRRLTGMTFEFAELSAKRLELLKEIAPAARRVGVVFDRRDASPRQGLAAAQAAAARLGVQLVELDLPSLLDAHGAPPGGLDGLLLIPGGAVASAAPAAMRLAAARRIATVGWTQGGALRDATLSYGVSDVEIARKAARLVVQVLNGRDAGELPIEQPTRFHLTLNLKTARALGLAVLPSLRLRADEVIE